MQDQLDLIIFQRHFETFIQMSQILTNLQLLELNWNLLEQIYHLPLHCKLLFAVSYAHHSVLANSVVSNV